MMSEVNYDSMREDLDKLQDEMDLIKHRMKKLEKDNQILIGNDDEFMRSIGKIVTSFNKHSKQINTITKILKFVQRACGSKAKRVRVRG